jgi:ribosomal-protein-alanine N-acetyltransferase
MHDHVPSMPEEIATPRLRLRPYRWQDIDDVMAYATDEAWARFLPVPWPYTRRDAEQFLATQVLLDPAREARWAIVLDGAVVGGVNLRRAPEHRLAELGYALARGVWGRGLATEAARAVIHAAFEADANLNRIRAVADSRNLASMRVLEKAGMTREGILRQNRMFRGELIDEVWYGILRKELGQ